MRFGIEAAFQAFVRRSSDRRLERTVGSARGLKVVFGAMTRAYVPERAAGWNGDIRYELTGAGGAVRTWTVSCDDAGARARAAAAPDPALTVRLGLADFVRLAGRDLDPVKALLTGRMDLEGDFDVAVRLGEMFGQPSSY